MAGQLLNLLGNLIGGAFSLSQEAFHLIISRVEGQTIALSVVLAAGLSLAIGQSIILFINQVKPIRFVLSLLLNAILFVFGFLFLVFSTWLVGLLPGFVRIPWSDLVTTLGLSYSPLLFSFLAALPYVGAPILNVLSVWHLLAMVVGVSTVAQIGGASAFTYVAFGWFMLHLLESTIGQPIAKFGRRLSQRVAGVDLVSQRSELTEMVQSGLETRVSSTEQMQAERISSTSIEYSNQVEPAITTRSNVTALQLQSPPTQTINVQVEHWFQKIPSMIRLGIILVGMLLLFLTIALLLRPIRLTLFGWYENLPRLVRWVFDLTWIGVVAIVFAGLLAPLEALGWWAGWYGDEVDTQDSFTASVTEPASRATSKLPSRYVVYVDGVGQSGEAYTPDVVDFLEALQPVLPKNVKFSQGLMLYSVRNKPLVENRPLAWVWRLADQMRWENPTALLGFLVNVRNAWIVAVSADRRYGPLYNQGISTIKALLRYFITA